MSMLLQRQYFHPSCPSGGTWYACGGSGSGFVGCCSSEPCSNGCPAGNLKPASFDPAYYGQFPDQECDTGSQWYTCTGTSPSFLGCCKANPCQNNGCPAGDLTAGFLSSNPKIAASFLESSAAPSSTTVAISTPTNIPTIVTSYISIIISKSIISQPASSISTVSPTFRSSSVLATTPASPSTVTASGLLLTTISTTTTTSTAGNSSATTAASQQPVALAPVAQSSPVGAITGGAVGGLAIIAIFIGLLMFYSRHRKSDSSSRRHTINDLGGLSELPADETFVSKVAKPPIFPDPPSLSDHPAYTPAIGPYDLTKGPYHPTISPFNSPHSSPYRPNFPQPYQTLNPHSSQSFAELPTPTPLTPPPRGLNDGFGSLNSPSARSEATWRPHVDSPPLQSQREASELSADESVRRAGTPF